MRFCNSASFSVVLEIADLCLLVFSSRALTRFFEVVPRPAFSSRAAAVLTSRIGSIDLMIKAE